MIRLDDANSRTLETLIDAHNLDGVLEALSEICHAKAEHLRSNWQDSATAKQWNQAASIVTKAASKVL